MSATSRWSRTRRANELQADVIAELAWERDLDQGAIGVSVRNGIVTLSGRVRTQAELGTAERAVGRVWGVRGIANEIEVTGEGILNRDADLIEAVRRALRWNSLLRESEIIPTVTEGYVRLDGAVEWEYQRLAAETSVRRLRGVLGVFNRLHIQQQSLGEPETKAHLPLYQATSSDRGPRPTDSVSRPRSAAEPDSAAIRAPC